MHQKVGIWSVVGVGMGVLFFHFGQFWSATWWSKWGFLALAFNVFFALWAAKKTSFWYFPLMLYVLTSATLMAFWAQFSYAKQFDTVIQIVLQKDALFAWVTALSLIWVFTEWKRAWSIGGVLVCHLVWLIGVCAYLCMPRGMPPNNGWYFGNPSMGAGLLAVLLPTLWGELDLIRIEGLKLGLCIAVWLLTALAIWRTGTSIPIGVLWLTTSAYILYRFPSWWTAGMVVSLTVFMASTGFMLLGHDLLDENGRSPIYKLAMAWTSQQELWAFGWGAGAAQTIVPILQITQHVREQQYFMWLHSDWLQFAVEFGYVGFVCLMAAVARLLSLNFTNREPASAAMLLGFMGMGLFNYPLRMPITAFVLLLVVSRVEHHAFVRRHHAGSAQAARRTPSSCTAAQLPL